MAASIEISKMYFAKVYSGTTVIADASVNIILEHIPYSEDVDLEWISSDPNLFTFSCSTYTEVIGEYRAYTGIFIPNGTGVTTFTVRDRNSGNEDSKTLYYKCSEHPGWPRMWWDPSTIVVPSENAPSESNNAILRTSGCVLPNWVPGGAIITSGDAQDWNVSTAVTPMANRVYKTGADTYYVSFSDIQSTTAGTRWKIYTDTYTDMDGNYHMVPLILEQSPGATPTPSPANIYCAWYPGLTVTFETSCDGLSADYADITEENCTLADRLDWSFEQLSGSSSFSPDVNIIRGVAPLPQIRVGLSGNTTDTTRTGIVRATFYDTDGNAYGPEELTIIQPPCGDSPVEDRFIRFQSSAITINGQHSACEAPLDVSGCTLDTGRCDVLSVLGDMTVTGTQLMVATTYSPEKITFRFPDSNTTPNTREVDIMVRFYDTSGNTYIDSIHITQPAASYCLISPNRHDIDYHAQTVCSEVVGVNCTINWIRSGTTYPFDSREVPIPTISGTNICVDMTEYTGTGVGGCMYYFKIGWTPTSGGTGETPVAVLIISQSGYTEPSERNITVADTEFSVGSGTSTASTSIMESGCTLSGWTYITGGSFSVTATSGPNKTIIFNVPENNTNQSRTGYVYLTFTDTDGNSYGPVTVSFTQAAGSGPGPGPDPETGYVYTSLTISDNEQHRFFLEARPGVAYSAAGQYYKTIPACEARYSLYYINSYGGVDVLPFRGGGQKKTDNITRYNYTKSFRNNTLEYENVNYMTEIKPAWLLRTGWLTTEQSLKMRELVESTMVYLYDAEEKTYTPVIMTDKKLEYKTFTNNGKRMIEYEVNIEESQSRERR